MRWGEGGGEATQALQDDQHPRLVHLVLRGMGEEGRGAGRLLSLCMKTSIQDSLFCSEGGWRELLRGWYGDLFRFFRRTNIADLVLRGWGRGVGQGAGDLFKFFRMTSIPDSLLRGWGRGVGQGAGDLFKFFRMTSIPDSFLKGWGRGEGE